MGRFNVGIHELLLLLLLITICEAAAVPTLVDLAVWPKLSRKRLMNICSFISAEDAMAALVSSTCKMPTIWVRNSRRVLVSCDGVDLVQVSSCMSSKHHKERENCISEWGYFQWDF